jgi:hypothetical protein
MLNFKWMMEVSMERLAESKAAASRPTPKRPGFHVEQTAQEEVPPLKILFGHKIELFMFSNRV